MKGRTEHRFLTEKRISERLEPKPIFIVDFYNQIQVKEYKTAEAYINYVLRFLKYMYGDKEDVSIAEISEIRASDINKYMNFISYKKFKSGEIADTSGSYRATMWTALNKFFEYLLGENLINSNPCVKTQRPSSKDKPKKVFMEPEELQIVVNNVINGVGSELAREKQLKWKNRDLLIVLLFIQTGIRVTALDELNVSDIDFKNNQLNIIDKRKTEYTYKVDLIVVEYLKKWLKEREELLGDAKCDALFISNRRQRMDTKSISKLIKKYTVGIDKHITPHKFRSSYATNLYRKTKDVNMVQNCMMHKDVSTTQRYITGDNDYKEAATKIMSELIHVPFEH